MNDKKAAQIDRAREISTGLGANIRWHRVRRGFTQQHLAEVVKIDRSYIGRVERGKVNLTLRLIYRIAEVLGCRVTDLLPNQGLAGQSASHDDRNTYGTSREGLAD